MVTTRDSDDDERLVALPGTAPDVGEPEPIVPAICGAVARRGHEAQVERLSEAARDRYAAVIRRLGT